MMKNKKSIYLFLALSMVMSVSGIKNYNNIKADNNPNGLNLKRVCGNNRYETSVEASKLLGNNIKKIILVNGKEYPDALSGGILVTDDSPMILTDGKTISSDAKKVLDSAEEIVVLGGEKSISQKLVNSLNKKVTRIGGANRYETSIKIAEKINSRGIILANGENFPDALSGTPLSQKNNMPIILIKPNKTQKELESFIENSKINKVIILGGESSVDSSLEDGLKKRVKDTRRISGNNRYETSLKIAREFEMPKNVIFASGHGFADALSSSTISAKYLSPVILVDKYLNNGITKYLKTLEYSLENIFIVGGEKSISLSLDNSISNFNNEKNVSEKKEFKNNKDLSLEKKNNNKERDELEVYRKKVEKEILKLGKLSKEEKEEYIKELNKKI